MWSQREREIIENIYKKQCEFHERSRVALQGLKLVHFYVIFGKSESFSIFINFPPFCTSSSPS